MARYSKMERTILNDAKFNPLSDDAQRVFFRLWVHPQLTALGTLRISLGGLAGERCWAFSRFSQALAEITAQGMVQFDEGAHLLGFPHFLKYNPPGIAEWGEILGRNRGEFAGGYAERKIEGQGTDFYPYLPDAFSSRVTHCFFSDPPFTKPPGEELMRDFSPVYTRFWIEPVMQSLSRDARLIALHLVTGPHTTMLGCFRLPPSYVAEDLKFSVAEVEAGFAELAAVDFFTFDTQSGWCVVHDFLKWNPIHNPSHAQGLEKLFAQVPQQGAVFKKLCLLLQQYPKYLRAAFIQGLHTMEKTVPPVCADPVQRVSPGSRHIDTDTDRDIEKETDIETETDTEIPVITRKEQENKGGVLPHIVAPARQDEDPSPPMLTVFDCWRTTLGHPQAVLDDKRKRLIRRALKSGYSVAQLCEAIRGCSLTPHNMGKNDRGQRYDGLHVILRDADQIDRFIRNAQSPPRERNAAEALIDSNLAVCEAWAQDKLAREGTLQ